MTKLIYVWTLVALLNLLTGCGSSESFYASPPLNCTVSSVTGGATIACSDKTTVFIPNGAEGAVGAQGVAGVDASGVTAVQLCPGVSDHNTFIEVGFCVDNKLYATYSANGGFSTYLAPGPYNSNAIGSSCSFTVVAGCNIQ